MTVEEYDVVVGYGIYLPLESVYPSKTVEGSVAKEKELLYVCVVWDDGQTLFGKLEDFKCLVGFGGSEKSYTNENYLVLVSTSKTTPSTIYCNSLSSL